MEQNVLLVTSNPFLSSLINCKEERIVQLLVDLRNPVEDLIAEPCTLSPNIDSIPVFVKVIPIFDRLDSTCQVGELPSKLECLLVDIMVQVRSQDGRGVRLLELTLRVAALLSRESTRSVVWSPPELRWHTAQHWLRVDCHEIRMREDWDNQLDCSTVRKAIAAFGRRGEGHYLKVQRVEEAVAEEGRSGFGTFRGWEQEAWLGYSTLDGTF